MSGGGAQRIPEVTKENIHTIVLFSIILEKKSRHSDGRWVMLKGGVSFNQSTVPEKHEEGRLLIRTVRGRGEGVCSRRGKVPPLLHEAIPKDPL